MSKHTELVKTWQSRLAYPHSNSREQTEQAMQSEIEELRNKLAALEGQPVSAAVPEGERERLIFVLRKYSDEWESLEEAGIQAQIDFAKAATMLEAANGITQEQAK